MNLTRVEVDHMRAEETWKTLEDAIHKVYMQDTRDLSFAELHKKAYNMVLHGYGRRLHSGLAKTVTEHLCEIAKVIESTTGRLLLEELNRQYLEYTKSMRMFSTIFMCMERMNATNFKKTCVHELGLNLWRDTIVRSSKISACLMDILLGLVFRERVGDIINKGLVQSIIEMLVDLGPAVFADEFQRPFLEGVAKCYRLGSQKLIETSDGDSFDYLRKAKRICRERDRASQHLVPESPEGQPWKINPITIVEREIIHDQMELLVGMDNSDGLVWIRGDDNYNHFASVYSLFRLLGCLQIIRNGVVHYMREIGRTLVMDPERWKDPVHFTTSVHSKCNVFVVPIACCHKTILFQ